MGVACSAFVQDKVEDVESCSIKSAGVGGGVHTARRCPHVQSTCGGLESEPLWKQMAQAQIESQKAAEAHGAELT